MIRPLTAPVMLLALTLGLFVAPEAMAKETPEVKETPSAKEKAPGKGAKKDSKKDDEPGPSVHDTRPHTDEQVNEAYARFDSDYKSQDLDRRIRILRWLGHYRHKRVFKTLSNVFRKEKDPELKAAAAEGLGSQVQSADRAARVLVAGLKKFKEYGNKVELADEDEEAQQAIEAKVLARAIDSLNRLDYRKAWDTVKGFIHHNDDDVAIAMIRFCERTKEYRALPIILEWYHFYPNGTSWAGGSVSVDTGSEGNADAKAAKAKFHAKYGKHRKRGRPAAYKAMVAAVKAITGESIVKPKALKEWISNHKDLIKRGHLKSKKKKK